MKLLKQLGKSICYVSLYFGMQLVISLLVVEVSKLWGCIQLSAGGLTLLLLWAFFKIRSKKLSREANLQGVSKQYWPAVLIGSVGLCLLINFGMELIPIPESVLTDYAESAQSLVEGPLIWQILANVIMAPLVEEILFRGLVFGRMRKAMSDWSALLFTSFFFGLMHGQVLWICYTTVVGLVLGYVAWKTDSIWTSIFMHFAFNLFGTTIGYFVEELTLTACIVCTALGLLGVVVCVWIIAKTAKKDRVEG